jgi:Slime mold cyclic AMP receptor
MTEAYDMIMYFICSISIISSGLIIATFVVLEELREYNFKMILYMTIADTFVPIGYLLTPGIDDTNICKAQGFLIAFGNLSCILWSLCIMVGLHKLIVKEKTVESWIKILFFVIAWVIPLAGTLSLINFYEKGEGEAWCALDHDDTYLVLSLFYVPLLIVTVLSIIIYVSIFFEISKQRESVIELRNAKKEVCKRLLFYPLILIICYFPVVISRFHIFFGIQEDYYFVKTLAMFGNCIHGFCNFLVYGCTGYIRKRIKSKFYEHLVNNSYSSVKN